MKFNPLPQSSSRRIRKSDKKVQRVEKKDSSSTNNVVKFKGVDLWKQDLVRSSSIRKSFENFYDSDYEPWKQDDVLCHLNGGCSLSDYNANTVTKTSALPKDSSSASSNNDSVTHHEITPITFSEKEPDSNCCNTCGSMSFFQLCQRCYGDQTSVDLLLSVVAESETKLKSANMKIAAQKIGHAALKQSMKKQSNNASKSLLKFQEFLSWIHLKTQSEKENTTLEDSYDILEKFFESKKSLEIQNELLQSSMKERQSELKSRQGVIDKQRHEISEMKIEREETQLLLSKLYIKEEEGTLTSIEQDLQLKKTKQAVLQMRQLLEKQVDEKEHTQRSYEELNLQHSKLQVDFEELQNQVSKLRQAQRSQDKSDRLYYMNASLGKKHLTTTA